MLLPVLGGLTLRRRCTQYTVFKYLVHSQRQSSTILEGVSMCQRDGLVILLVTVFSLFATPNVRAVEHDVAMDESDKTPPKRVIIVRADYEDGQASGVSEAQVADSSTIDTQRILKIVRTLKEGESEDEMLELVAALEAEVDGPIEVMVKREDMDYALGDRSGASKHIRHHRAPHNSYPHNGLPHRLPLGHQRMARPPLSKEAAQCILSRLTKIDVPSSARLLREACSVLHPLQASD